MQGKKLLKILHFFKKEFWLKINLIWIENLEKHLTK